MQPLQRVQPKVQTVLGTSHLEAQHIAVVPHGRDVVTAAHRHTRAGVEGERDEPLILFGFRALAVDEHGVDLRHGHDDAAVYPAGADDAGGALREAANAVCTRLGVVTRLAQTKQGMENLV